MTRALAVSDYDKDELTMKSMKHLGLQLRLTFYSGKSADEGTFGKGIAILLRGVSDLGSLNAAAKKIHMAYSKAWRIVKETEAGFGFNLINRDGARGSTLTPEGRKLLDAYEELEAKGSEFLAVHFKELVTKK
ncbi:MAG: LysR family transcriptional regulator [Coriobacteriales bacterium]|jgi:molybdate transport system regulatory protein|nr:LysR family transcriptional regulator [Coriobacteriales bacterium]